MGGGDKQLSGQSQNTLDLGGFINLIKKSETRVDCPRAQPTYPCGSWGKTQAFFMLLEGCEPCRHRSRYLLRCQAVLSGYLGLLCGVSWVMSKTGQGKQDNKKYSISLDNSNQL